MWISRRALFASYAVVIGCLTMALSAGAFGSHGRDDRGDHHRRHHAAPLLASSLAPSLPGDPALHGVNPGAAPWVLRRGEVTVRRGRLDLRVRGLVIPDPPGDGTPGPVSTISASLYCGADSNAAPADTTQQVPISRRGDARIRDRSFTVPADCLAPVVLVHPNGNASLYIAVDGRRD